MEIAMTSPATPLEALVAARTLISDPGRWAQGTYAKDTNGRSVWPDSAEACCWCSVGALNRTHASTQIRVEAAHALGETVKQSVVDFNDRIETTHADVLAAFDAAIARLTPKVA
jgi:hypothetical protein